MPRPPFAAQKAHFFEHWLVEKHELGSIFPDTQSEGSPRTGRFFCQQVFGRLTQGEGAATPLSPGVTVSIEEEYDDRTLKHLGLGTSACNDYSC